MNLEKLFLATTDTVPGIGAPYTKEGEKALYELKKRPLEKKFIIMVSDIEMARTIDGWNEKAEEIANVVWPGAVTLVIDEETAIRIPDKEKLIDLIRTKGPIYMSSANISGEPQLSYEEAKEKFKGLGNYYDFGVGSGEPSTIIRVQDGKVLR